MARPRLYSPFAGPFEFAPENWETTIDVSRTLQRPPPPSPGHSTRAVLFAPLLLPALLTVFCCACGPAPPQHAILITVDTMRADRFGAGGHEQARTPHLDAFASDAIYFTRAFAHSSFTVPSMASLHTGRLPGEHKLFVNYGKLPQEMPSLAKVLRGRGFETGAFIGSYALRPSRRFNQGFMTYTDDFNSSEAFRDQPENRAGPLTDAALAWLRKREPDQRIFLWIHYQEPHGPYTPETFDPPDAEGLELPMNPKNTGIGGIPKYQWLGHGRLAEYEARYDGEITDTDRALGRFLEGLKQLGLFDDSVIVFTSDHGEAFGEDDLFCTHGEGLSDALLRVPLIVRVPQSPPVVRDDTVRLIDVASTMLEVLQVRLDRLGGHSLLEDLGDRTVVAQVGRSEKERWRSVRIRDYELRENGNEVRTLLRGGTIVDSADSNSWEQTLARVLELNAPWPTDRKKEPALSEEERANLKALGYVD